MVSKLYRLVPMCCPCSCPNVAKLSLGAFYSWNQVKGKKLFCSAQMMTHIPWNRARVKTTNLSMAVVRFQSSLSPSRIIVYPCQSVSENSKKAFFLRKKSLTGVGGDNSPKVPKFCLKKPVLPLEKPTFSTKNHFLSPKGRVWVGGVTILAFFL